MRLIVKPPRQCWRIQGIPPLFSQGRLDLIEWSNLVERYFSHKEGSLLKYTKCTITICVHRFGSIRCLPEGSYLINLIPGPWRLAERNSLETTVGGEWTFIEMGKLVIEFLRTLLCDIYEEVNGSEKISWGKIPCFFLHLVKVVYHIPMIFEV